MAIDTAQRIEVRYRDLAALIVRRGLSTRVVAAAIEPPLSARRLRELLSRPGIAADRDIVRIGAAVDRVLRDLAGAGESIS